MPSHFSYVWLFATPWKVAHQAPLSTGFSRQEYWSGLPCPPARELPDPGIQPEPLTSPASANGFFTTSSTWEAWRRSQRRKFLIRAQQAIWGLDEGQLHVVWLSLPSLHTSFLLLPAALVNWGPATTRIGAQAGHDGVTVNRVLQSVGSQRGRHDLVTGRWQLTTPPLDPLSTALPAPPPVPGGRPPWTLLMGFSGSLEVNQKPAGQEEGAVRECASAATSMLGDGCPCWFLHPGWVTQSCPTLCDPTQCSTPDFLSFTISQNLLKLMSSEPVMSPNHLILCCPLLHSGPHSCCSSSRRLLGTPLPLSLLPAITSPGYPTTSHQSP